MNDENRDLGEENRTEEVTPVAVEAVSVNESEVEEPIAAPPADEVAASPSSDPDTVAAIETSALSENSSQTASEDAQPTAAGEAPAAEVKAEVKPSRKRKPIPEVDDETEEARAERIAGLSWFVVQAYSGFEMKARQALEERIRVSKIWKKFGEVRVPQETVVELVRGEKKTSNRKFFPGYILVQMEMNEDTWHLVKETPKISGFIGDAKNPEPMSTEEVERIFHQVEEGAQSPRARMAFEEGEKVKVVDGPFAEFNGTIEKVDRDRGKLRVLISIFGRATPLELDFMQVEKS